MKKQPKITFTAKVSKIKKAGISNVKAVNSMAGQNPDELLPINERIKNTLGIINKPAKTTTMKYFVMYDIENDKVRLQVSKFLIRKGCIRVQKSIFLADTERIVFEEIYNAMKEINEIYDNHDSVFLVPVSSDELRAMKVIGQNVSFDMITENRNTLFF